MADKSLKLLPRRKLLAVLPPVILILANISLFGPLTIYQGNIAEFGYPFLSIIENFIISSLIAAAILCIIGIFLPDSIHRIYVAGLFILGILIWLQGNIFVWNYGVFDGRSIDWAQDAWRGWIDGTVWVLLLGVALTFHRQLYKIAASGSMAIVVLQMILAGYTGMTRPDLWKTDFPQPGVTPKWASEFSDKTNVIQLIMDGVQSDIFQEIVDEHPEYYADAFNGFTFFREATGHFQSTHFSVPAIISGELYKNDIPMNEFLKKTYNGKTSINALHEHGFEVDLVPWSSIVPKAKADNYYAIPSPYAGSITEFERSKTTLLFDLVLFRHAPHLLKRAIYNDQKWLTQQSIVDDERLQFRRFGDEEFLKDVTNEMTVTREKPVYKLFHLESSHPPFVTDSTCGYAGKVLPVTRENIKAQIRCTFESVVHFLEKLKSAGVYNDALIIVQADHGYVGPLHLKESRGPVEGYSLAPWMTSSALPLLLVKPPRSSDGFHISNAQVMLMDIPATITGVLNIPVTFPGKSMFTVDSAEIRDRIFKYFVWAQADWNADFLPPLDEYAIKGSVFERSSWRLLPDDPGNHSLFTKKIDLGTKDADRFLRYGWSYKELNPDEKGMTVTWATGKSASVKVSLPKSPLRLRARVKSNFYVGEQHVTVLVDGKKVGDWKNSKWGEWEFIDVTVPADPARPAVSIIEYTYSKALQPKGSEYRWLAMPFDYISIE